MSRCFLDRRPCSSSRLLPGSLALIGLLVGVLTPRPAVPSPADSSLGSVCPQSREQSKIAGDEAMLAEDYAQALSCYEAAYVYSPAPLLLYNRARALQMLGRYAEALTQLRFFVRAAPVDLQARVPGLMDLVESLEAKVAHLQVDCPVQGAQVFVDQRQVAELPLAEAVPVDVGRPQIEVRAPGYTPWSRTVAATAGARLLIVAELSKATQAEAGPPLVAVPPRASESAAPTDATGAQSAVQSEPAAQAATPLEPAAATAPAATGPGWPTWLVLGVGAASTGLAVFSFVQTSSAASDVCRGASDCTESQHDAAALDRYETWKDVYVGSAIVGVIGLAVGGVMFWQSAEGDAEASLSPTGVQWRGRF